MATPDDKKTTHDVTVAPVSASASDTGSTNKEKGAVSDSDNLEEQRQRILAEQAAIRNEPKLTTNLASLWTRSKKTYKPEDIATQPSVFDDPALVKYFGMSTNFLSAHTISPSTSVLLKVYLDYQLMLATSRAEREIREPPPLRSLLPLDLG